jgi:hypothetical protein
LSPYDVESSSVASQELVKRADVVRFFAERAFEIGANINRTALESLPPYTLNRLILGEHPRMGSPEELFLGQEDQQAGRYGSILLSPAGFHPSLLERYVPGHVALKAPGVFDWVRLALEDLRQIGNGSWEFIQEWISVIVWMEKKQRKTATELTSLSVPMLPCATFITKKAIRHLPPKELLRCVGYYGLQENIYHEALHQQLICFSIMREILIDDPACLPVIEVPWRGACWPLDRVLHAAWVYQGLSRFRRNYVSARPLDALATTLRYYSLEADEAQRFLVDALMPHRQLFTDAGKEAVERLSAGLDQKPVVTMARH